MLTVWGRQSSSNVQALMWCITELGLPVTRIDAGFTYGLTDTASYQAMNPNGTIPTLQDDDNIPIWETAAILRYLATNYAPDAFWPQDPQERVRVDQWAEWSKINVALNFTSPIFWRVVRVPEAKKDPQAIRDAVQALSHWLSIANDQLSQSVYLAGSQFTLADIQFGHCLYRYFDIDIDRPVLKNVHRYYLQLTERTAFREHVMLDYSELRDTK